MFHKWNMKTFGDFDGFALGARAIIRPRIGFAANRQTILVDAARAGLGIANLPKFLIEDAIATGSLLPVLPDWEPSPVEMTALWQRDRITERLIKAIVGAFEEALRFNPTEVLIGSGTR
jgi:DNA-binding transcriptional LysR family regulator